MKKSLVKIFSELSYLESKRDRYFPSRAFSKVSKQISDCLTIMDNGLLLMHDNSIIKLGSSSTAIVEEFKISRTCSRLVKLQSELNLSSTLSDELIRIKGIGYAKAKRLVENDYYTDLEDFISKLPKVGELIGNSGIRYTNMMEIGVKILLNTSGERLPWNDANKLADLIINFVKSKTNINHKCYKLGSLRRNNSTVGDIDLVVSNCDSENFESLRYLFSSYLDEILVHGSSKIAGIKNNFQVDIRFIPEKYLGAHILHGTGSAKMNILMRNRAKSLGYRLNEYGILIQDKLKTFRDEKSIFKFLKVNYINPEDRSDVEYLSYC